MSFWRSLFSWRNSVAPPVVDAQQESVDVERDVSVRRWDASYTDRLNGAQFERVTGNSINEDLVDRLPSLIQRCEYEASVNPIVSGIIDTHAIDIIGPNGPQWGVVPRDPSSVMDDEKVRNQFTKWKKAADELISEWFKLPDLNGELSGVEILSQDVYHQWTSGNSFVQFTIDKSAPKKKVQSRWNPIAPVRILNEAWQYSKLENGNFMNLGIVRTPYGKKIEYRVAKPDAYGGYHSVSEYETVKSMDMIHRYKAREAGQICGVPLLAASLHVLGDLRQYDKYVMEAAKLAASFGIVFEDKFDPAKGPTGTRRASGTVPVMRGGAAQVMHAPPNKEAVQIDPKQPHGQYVEFRCERLRDVGRAAQMPLLLVRLGAEDHSFSSARFDAQIYQRSISVLQTDLQRKYGRSLDLVLREAELIGLIPVRPVPIDVCAIFTPLPHVDPAKEAKARELDLDSFVTTLPQVWRESGKRPEDAIAEIRDQIDLLNSIRPGMGDMWFQTAIMGKAPKEPAQQGA